LQDDRKNILQYFSKSKEFANKLISSFPKETNISIESDDGYMIVEIKANDFAKVFNFLKVKKIKTSAKRVK